MDIMGGDKAPGNLIEGACLALKNIPNLHLALVGDSKIIENALKKRQYPPGQIEIIHASDVVKMSDPPVKAVQDKKDSSIAVALTLHRMGYVQAVVGAGNTGAQVVASMIKLGRIEGVLRPVIGSFIPAKDASCFLLDVGANLDCRSVYLFQFGVMGAIFVKTMMGTENPRVGILSIGEEKNKGNEVTLFAHYLLSKSHLNFIGNIEGSDILLGKADVAVCDGFVGNLILKFAESFPKFILSNIPRNPENESQNRNLEEFFQGKFDRDSYGGVPILGINGVSIVCHGSSSPAAIANAVGVAVEMVNKEIPQKIAQELSELHRFYEMNKFFINLRKRWENRQRKIFWNPKRFFTWFSDSKPE